MYIYIYSVIKGAMQCLVFSNAYYGFHTEKLVGLFHTCFLLCQGKGHFLDFHHHFPVHVGSARSLGQTKLGVPLFDFHLHNANVARHDGFLPLDSVHSGKEKDCSRLGTLHLQANDTRQLRERFHLQDTRHNGAAGKVAIEKVFVLGDALDAHGALASFVLDDLVHQGEGIAVRQKCVNFFRGKDRFDAAGERGNGLGAFCLFDVVLVLAKETAGGALLSQ